MENDEDDATKGQGEIWDLVYDYSSSMVVKCAVELHIPDIIHENGGPMTLPQILSQIKGVTTTDVTYLERVMQLLVRKKLFLRISPTMEGGDATYGLTEASKWLINDNSENSMYETVLLNHPWMWLPWHCLGVSIKLGENAFNRVHGRSFWNFAAENVEFNKLFMEGMAGSSKVVLKTILSKYKDGFKGLKSIVDLGGGLGDAAATIVKAYPDIKAINFDLEHVIGLAPQHNGVTHMGGNFFENVPQADAIFMKFVLHDWSDEDCIKILKNCRNAIPKTGKVIIIEVVLEPDGYAPFDHMAVVYDLCMMAYNDAGKERTESEWKELLYKGGFTHCNVIRTQALTAVIEGYLS